MGSQREIREYYYGNGMLLAARDMEKESGHGFGGYGGWYRNLLEDVTFYHHDALGSVVMLTNDQGHVVEKYEYDVYGNAYNGKFSTTKESFGHGYPFGYGYGHCYRYGYSGCGSKPGNVYGFTGQRFEPESRLYAFTYRRYNPQTMRWLTVDPVKDGLNWYEYCGGDPVNCVDLLGLKLVLAPGTTEEEEKAYNEAIEYIKQSERGNELINNLENYDESIVIEIKPNTDEDYYNQYTNTISWDPFSGLRTGKGEVQPPSLGLAHEMGHADQDINSELDGKDVNTIENENLKNTETPIAEELGLPVREDYYDVDYNDPTPKTFGPNSTSPTIGDYPIPYPFPFQYGLDPTIYLGNQNNVEGGKMK